MRRARFLALALLIALAAGLLRLPLRAQQDTIPKEVTALFDDIDDIDKLRVLNPLKLTPEQIDKIIAVIQERERDYNAKLTQAAVPPIRELAMDIKETRRKMLSGAPLPADFEAKVKQIQSDFDRRRKKEDDATLLAMAAAIKQILTKEQFDKAVSISAKIVESKAPTAKRGNDDQYFNYYVLGAFIVYPRIVPLLQDMKAAAGTGGGGMAARDRAFREARR